MFFAFWFACFVVYVPEARSGIIEVQVNTLLNPGDSMDILGDDVISLYRFVRFAPYEPGSDAIPWYVSIARVTSADGAGGLVAPGTLIGPSTFFVGMVDFENQLPEEQAYPGYYNYYYDNFVFPLDQDLLIPTQFVNNGDYGWIDLSAHYLGPSSGFQITVKSYSYDNTGAAILAGAAPTPEPGTGWLLTLSLGMVIYTIHRRSPMEPSGKV